MRANGYNHSPEGRETRRRSGDWVTNDVENLQQVAPSAGEAVSGSDVGTTVIEVTRSLRTGSSFSSDAADEQNQPSGRPSRRIKPKQYDENYIDSGSVFQAMREQKQESKATLSVPVDAEANILAALDEDAYQNAIYCDADRILHQYLLPMGYPWSEFQPESHDLRVYPRDIDEMPEILGMDDCTYAPFNDGTFGYGKFEVGKTLKALASKEYQHGKRAATRRSNDPGVIELTVLNSDESPTATSHSLSPAAKDQTKTSGRDEILMSPRRSTRKRKNEDADIRTGPLYLLGYIRRAEDIKKRKVGDYSSIIQQKFISVRFGSTSSRATILGDETKLAAEDSASAPADNGIENAPLLVKVSLPFEVQNGRQLIVPKAIEHAEELGSYDMRFGMSELNNSSKSNRAKRVMTGRTRQMWTKAHVGTSSSSRARISFSSILTGDRIDIAQFKRPREVVLAVRLNGIRLSLKKKDAVSPKSVMDRHSVDDEQSVAAASGLSDKMVSSAIAAAICQVPPRKSRKGKALEIKGITPFRTGPLSFLQDEEFLQGLLKSRKAEAATSKRLAKLDQSRAAGTVVGASGYRLPTLDCLPTVDGLIRVLCTVSGDMKPQWVPGILHMDEEEAVTISCSVCFGSNESEPVETCRDCGVTVHLSCCVDKGRRSSDRKDWRCAVCSVGRDCVPSPTSSEDTPGKRRSKAPVRFRDGENPATETSAKPNTSSLQCQFCPHSGGAMSPLKGTSGYVHEVCRIWTSQPKTSEDNCHVDEVTTNPLLNPLRTICALCGGRVRDVDKGPFEELVKCAAAGCQVRFHPMCGLLSSKLSSATAHGEMPSNKLQRMNTLDSQLCNQYTLTMMKCMIEEEGGKESTTILPVVFCGFHNPIRDTSLYGCYPCGGLIGDAMRVPPSNIESKQDPMPI